MSTRSSRAATAAKSSASSHLLSGQGAHRLVVTVEWEATEEEQLDINPERQTMCAALGNGSLANAAYRDWAAIVLYTNSIPTLTAHVRRGQVRTHSTRVVSLVPPSPSPA